MAAKKKTEDDTTKPAAGSAAELKARSAKIAGALNSAITTMVKKKYNSNIEAISLHSSPIPAITTGNINLDNLIGGSLSLDKTGPICAGYPRKKITEIFGPEGSGKTTLAIAAAVQVIKRGGLVMFLDFENSLDHKYASSLGIDLNNKDQFLLYQPPNMEAGMDMITLAIKIGVDLVIVDSVAAMVPAAELEKSASDAAKVGVRASKLSEILPKFVLMMNLEENLKNNPKGTALVFLNQLRAEIKSGPMGGGGESSAGGKALKFYASLRISVVRISSETIEIVDPVTKLRVKRPYGNQTIVKIVKTKVDSKQGATTKIFIRYGQGVDNILSMIEGSIAHKLMSRAGAVYTFQGQTFKGKDTFRKFFENNPEIYEAQLKMLNDVLTQSTGIVSDDDSDDGEDELDAHLRDQVNEVESEVIEEAAYAE